MQAQRRNIELKATDPDLSASPEVGRTLRAEDHGTIAQRDTYFEVARGGLKLREDVMSRNLTGRLRGRIEETIQDGSRVIVAFRVDTTI